MLRVCLAGATGWAGSALARGIARADDLDLTAALARSSAGRPLGEVLDEPRLTCSIAATVDEALSQPCDVFVEYTRPESAKANVLSALRHGAHVVIATSGLGDDDFAEIDRVARSLDRGVLAVGNFALTVVLLQQFAARAARYLPQWEIVDYASDRKPDAPSGTAREIAHRLAAIRAPEPTVPLDQTQGPIESRGATIGGTQVHSIRLPGYTISVEVMFGLPDQKLILRHEAGSSAEPYVDGALLAIRRVHTLRGLHRSLETVLDAD